MTDYAALLPVLSAAGVEFIVIGGVAAIAHGSARSTLDLDVVYRRSSENIARVVSALRPYNPYLRGAPAGLPFAFDVHTIRAGLNFTLVTTLGDIDLLGEVCGGGNYETLLPESMTMEVYGYRCRCLTLQKLIDVKRAAGRPKDFEAIAELEVIREEIERTGGAA
jgi:predicted nucleotidyltransferase